MPNEWLALAWVLRRSHDLACIAFTGVDMLVLSFADARMECGGAWVAVDTPNRVRVAYGKKPSPLRDRYHVHSAHPAKGTVTEVCLRKRDGTKGAYAMCCGVVAAGRPVDVMHEKAARFSGGDDSCVVTFVIDLRRRGGVGGGGADGAHIQLRAGDGHEARFPVPEGGDDLCLVCYTYAPDQEWELLGVWEHLSLKGC